MSSRAATPEAYPLCVAGSGARFRHVEDAPRVEGRRSWTRLGFVLGLVLGVVLTVGALA